MEVLILIFKLVQNYVGNWLLVYLYCEFCEKEKFGVIIFYVWVDDVILQFFLFIEGFI